MWKWVTIGVVCLLAVSVIGAEKTLVIAIDDWKTLDPAYLTLQRESAIAKFVYNGLVGWEYGSTNIVPDLATSWEVSEDGTEYVFHLRHGVKWHDPEYGELTAFDVKYSFDRVLDPATQAPLAKSYAMIDRVEVVDPYTVKFILKYPFPGFLHRVAGYKADFIVKKEAVEKWGPDYGLHPVGTGPFKWVTGDPRGDIVLVAFDDYFKGRPKIDKVILRHIPDPDVAVAAFEAGDVDIVPIPNAVILERFQRDPNVRISTAVGLNLNYIVMNNAVPPFNDIRVRKAVLHAINKEELFDTILKGVAADLTGPLPASALYYDPNVPKYEYNPSLAKQLLAEAGYPNGFSTTLYTYVGRLSVDVCIAIQAQLRQVGINVDVKVLEIAAWAEVVKTGTTPMAFMRITRPPEPDEFLRPVVLSTSFPAWNFGRYVNPTVDALIEAGSKETDPQKRAKIYSEIQRLVVEDACNVWLFSDVVATAYRPFIVGFKEDPFWNTLINENVDIVK